MQPHFLLLLSALQCPGLPAAPFQKREVLPNYVLLPTSSGPARQEKAICEDTASLARLLQHHEAQRSQQMPAPWLCPWGCGAGEVLVPWQQEVYPGSCHTVHAIPCWLELPWGMQMFRGEPSAAEEFCSTLGCPLFSFKAIPPLPASHSQKTRFHQWGIWSTPVLCLLHTMGHSTGGLRKS